MTDGDSPKKISATKTDETDVIPPNPEGKAEQLLSQEPAAPRRGRGRPKGSTNKKTTAQPEMPVDAPISEAEIQSMATLFGFLWMIVAVRVAGLTNIDEEEKRQLGTAAVPVFRKYAAIFGDFGPEITLIVVAGGLVAAHLPPKRIEAIQGNDNSQGVYRGSAGRQVFLDPETGMPLT